MLRIYIWYVWLSKTQFVWICHAFEANHANSLNLTSYN